jgi:hypothetical protein
VLGKDYSTLYKGVFSQNSVELMEVKIGVMIQSIFKWVQNTSAAAPTPTPAATPTTAPEPTSTPNYIHAYPSLSPMPTPTSEEEI